MPTNDRTQRDDDLARASDWSNGQSIKPNPLYAPDLQAPQFTWAPPPGQQQGQKQASVPRFTGQTLPWHGGGMPQDLSHASKGYEPVIPPDAVYQQQPKDPRPIGQKIGSTAWNMGVLPRLNVPQQGLLPNLSIDYNPIEDRSRINGGAARWKFDY
jgi:hypothetical protein